MERGGRDRRRKEERRCLEEVEESRGGRGRGKGEKRGGKGGKWREEGEGRGGEVERG